MSRCDPCKAGSHDECNHAPTTPCDCLVCIAAQIGQAVFGDVPPPAKDRDKWEATEDDR